MPEEGDIMSAEDTAKDTPKKQRNWRRTIIHGVIIAVVVIVVVFVIVMLAGRLFTAAERSVRSDWSVDTGELIVSDDDLGIDVYSSTAASDELTIVQLTPTDVGDEGFTYYDVGVQDRLVSAISDLKSIPVSDEWTATNPLAVLNPFGTGSNGLYLYFTTDMETRVDYTVHVDDDAIPDYSATAANTWIDDDKEDSGKEYSREHEFQLIGLVPGKTNEVTMTVTGSRGNVRQQVTFSVDMPSPQSGYSTHLDSTEGESDAELSDGLYAAMRTNGYLGYVFYFDNSGTMRYEMVLEGYGIDRMLNYEGDKLITASSNKIARIDGLGRVKQVYELGEYNMHHDINYTNDEDAVVVLAEHSGAEATEDLVLELNLVTGEVSELIDFTSFMDDYVSEYSRVIGPTDPFFWQAGERDWIHLNTVQWLPGEDSFIVSSRETSTIMKIENVHDNPEIAYFIGDDSFWKGTPYEDLCFEQVGDFTLQYGQHSVEFDGAYEKESATDDNGSSDGEAGSSVDAEKATDCYYLLLFDNNFWVLSTRSGYEPQLDDGVSRNVYGDPGASSYVYRYLVDEEAETFELVDSFAVPYSSIVSNVSHAPESTNYIVNSGVANVFGEYTEDGTLIKQFSYECDLNGYRFFKYDFLDFWFE